MSRKTAKADVIPVRQANQYNCMTTSLAMALRALGVPEDECSPQQVNKVVGAMPLRGAAWEPLLAAANHYGMRATLTLPSTVKQLKQWTDDGTPVVIAWNPEGREWSHASLVFDVTKDDDHGYLVHIADPNIPDPDETVRVMPKAEFYDKWYEKAAQGFMIRRPACAIQREITPDGKQVMASRVVSKHTTKSASWKRVNGGSSKYVTDDLLLFVIPEDVWETVKDRNVPDEEPYMETDGIPELEEEHGDMIRDWERDVERGWWMKPVKAQKWKIYATHRPTRKSFESDPFDTQREAFRMADIAIPKIQARRRPRWLKPDSDNEAATMRSAKRRGRKPQENRPKKDKNAPMILKYDHTKSPGKDPFSDSSKHRRNDGASRMKNKVLDRKKKHRERLHASAARVATMYLIREEG